MNALSIPAAREAVKGNILERLDMARTEAQVKAVEGVADCTVDLQGERATVGMDDAKRTQAVIDVVKKLGYEVEPIDESAPAPSTKPTAPAAEPTAPATTPAT